MKIALMLLLATTAEASPRWSAPTPYGDVVLAKRWDPPDEQLEMLRGRLGEYFGRAFRVAAEHSVSHAWVVFAADWDSGGTWPKGQTIGLVMKDGRVIDAAMLMAMTPIPACNPIVLGAYDRRLDPSELEHTNSARGLAILAGFPVPGLSLGDVRGVQVHQRAPSAAPAPAMGRSQ